MLRVLVRRLLTRHSWDFSGSLIFCYLLHIFFGDWLGLRLLLSSLKRGSDFQLEVWYIEIVEEVLILHQLNLKVLVCLVVVGYQIVDGLEERCQTLTVILFLKQKLLLREYLHQIDETIRSLPAQLLCVRGDV